MVERICGTPADSIRQVWDMIASTAGKDKAMTILYALGWTQHSVGAQNVRAGTMVQLLLGNIGVAGGGMNALRGHSNIQGLTDIGLMTTTPTSPSARRSRCAPTRCRSGRTIRSSTSA
ncbi:hypothetical protein G6F54_014031 [Rhizopus delemar]|nr:hypothetical protein G6F54_014031 [Rhizopus delemar]